MMREDTTMKYSPGPKQQVEALELYLKYKGMLRNSSKELEDQQIAKTKADVRKSEAEADIMEAKASAYRTPEGQYGGLNKLLAAIDESIPKDGDVNDNSD